MTKIVSGILIGLVFSACAGMVIPRLESRDLYVHDSGRLFFRYCAKRSLFKKECKEWKEDFYDLKDPTIRLLLKDFTCHNKFRDF